MTIKFFLSRCWETCRKHWREPFEGVIAGATLALLVSLVMPLLAPVINWGKSKLPGAIKNNAHWPDGGTMFISIALIAAAIILANPLRHFLLRAARSWRAGLIRGHFWLWSIMVFAALIASPTSRFHHPRLFILSAAIYSLLTLAVSAFHTSAVDVTRILGQLDIPRDQLQHMRASALPAEKFVQVLSNPNPIKAWEEDFVGRAHFLELVLQHAIVHEDPVIAITAGFGEGKSSLLNLLKAALEPCSDVVSVPFSSLLPGGEQTLVASLLSSITKSVKDRFVVPGLRKDLMRYGRTVAGVIPKVSDSFKELFAGPSQAEEVSELKQILERLPVRILVLVDEIDRLQPDELAVLLKLLRGVSDLPNLVYVCAFNKRAVAQLLTMGIPRERHEYLEKFFPVELPMPKADEELLHNLFAIRLNQLRSAYSNASDSDEKFVTETWQELWSKVAKRFFCNLRRLSTYFKNLESTVKSIGKETNFFDLSVLEAIRELDSTIVDYVYGHGQLFYFPGWRVSRWHERLSVDDDRDRQQMKPQFDEFFATVDPALRNDVLTLMAEIFPTVAAYVANTTIARENSNEADRLKRIYHPDYFHRYFIHDVPASLYGEQELASFIERLNLSKDERAVTQTLRDELAILNNIPLRRADFYDRLPPALSKVKDEQAEMLAHCVADLASTLEPDFLGFGEAGRGRAIVFQVANRFTGSSKAQQVIQEAIRRSTSDGFASDLLFFSVNQDKNQIVRDWKHINVEQLTLAFNERMRRKYNPVDAPPIPQDLASLTAFFRWSTGGSNEQKSIQEYLGAKFDEGPNQVANFIAWAFRGDVTYSDNAEGISKLFPVEELKLRSARLESEVSLDETKTAALQRFRTLCGVNGDR